MDNDKIDEKFNKEKLTSLWNHKSLQNHSLERWFRNSPFEKRKKVFLLYLQHLENFTGKENLAMMRWSGLSSYSDDHPLQVAECVELLIKKRAKNYINNDIKIILEKLIEKKINAVDTVCKRIMEELALLGHDYSDLL